MDCGWGRQRCSLEEMKLNSKTAQKGRSHSWACKGTEAGRPGNYGIRELTFTGANGRRGNKVRKVTLERASNATLRQRLPVPPRLFSGS